MDSRLELDRLRTLYGGAGGPNRVRREAREQVARAYVITLSAKFQRFCRDLHSEGVEFLAGSHAVPAIRRLVAASLTHRRALDVGNSTPGNIGADFGRFDVSRTAFGT